MKQRFIKINVDVTFKLHHTKQNNNIIGNTGIQNALSRTHFKNILKNLHLPNNITADHAGKACKVHLLIDHFKMYSWK